MKRPILGMLFALAACLTISLPAQAVPIHRHVWSKKPLPDGVHQPLLLRVVKLDVAPPYVPPKPAPVAVSSPAEIAPTLAPVSVAPAPVSTGGCTGMEAESGSAGYAATPDGPYIGCYQISADHYDGGSCAGLGTDPAGQDACAAIICQTEGAGAWTNPAGENPCGRLGG